MLRRWVLPILFLLSFGAAGAWLLLVRDGGGPTPAAGPSKRGDAPGGAAPAVPDPPFGILYGGELGGRFWIPPCSLARLGGPHRVVDLVRGMRGATNIAMVVDTGDLVSAPGAAGALEYEAGLRFLDAAGPAFSAVGEKDLLVGLDRWREAKARALGGVSVLCANLRDEQGREIAAAAAPLAIGRLRGLVVGVLSPSYEKELREAGVAVRLLPAAAAVREAVAREGRVDFLAVISHAPFAESKALLREVAEADVVFTPHAEPGSDVTTEIVDGRLLAVAGGGWQTVGGVSFGATAPGGRPMYLEGSVRPVPMDPAPPPPVKAALDEILGRARAPGVLEGSLREKAARDPVARFVGPQACATCHPTAHMELRKEGAPHARSLEPVKARGFLRVHQCLSCHATAPGWKGGHVEPGDAQAAVSCEACHGPGAEHAATEGRAKLLDAKASCASCHSPEMHPGFRFQDAWPKVKHGR